jgi:glycosyltransferase involved in cell wall biosynthesis
LLFGMSWFPDVPGGLNRYLADLHAALAVDGGPAPHTLVLGPCAFPPRGVIAVSDHRRPLPIRCFHLVKAARAIVNQTQVIDAHFALYALPVILWPARKLPLVVHFQGPWADESSSAGSSWVAVQAKRLVERHVYRRAARIVTLSEAFKRVIVESYRVAPWIVEVVPPPVDLKRFSPGNRSEARARLSIPADALVISTVRRLVPRMGISTLLRAWKLATNELPPPVLLIVVGQGPEDDSVRQLAAQLDLGESVRFSSQISDDDLVQLYRASNAVIVPSLALEGFGLVTLEALACGTPVVCSNVGGLPEAVEGLDASVLVPPGDELALAARLVTAFNGQAPLPSAEASRKHAETFSPVRVAARHRDIYRNAARHCFDRKVRVVYLDHCARESGGELALLRLLTALHEVDAHVILGEKGPLVDLLRKEGISTEVLPMDPSVRDLRKGHVTARDLSFASIWKTLLYSLKVAWRLHSLKPDIVHTNSLKAALYGGIAARVVGLPVVWHIRDRIDPDYLPKAAVRLIHGLSIAIPSALIANSHSTLATLSTYRGTRSVIPSPVIYDAVSPHKPSPSARSSSQIHVAMVGRLAPWKGQHLFINAFAAAFPEPGPTATIVGGPLFGEADYEDRLRHQISSLGLQGRVHLTGHVTDVRQILGASDIAVNASITPEPFGLVIVEAMAAGLPVVAPNAGGPSEIITDNVNGLLFEPGSVAALTVVLRRLYDDPMLRVRLGDAARTRSVDFSSDAIARDVFAFYQTVLKSCRRRGTSFRSRPDQYDRPDHTTHSRQVI